MASAGKNMADVHLNPVPGTNVVFHSPGVTPTSQGAGQAVTVTKDASGKTLSTSGQVPGSTIIHTNPA